MRDRLRDSLSIIPKHPGVYFFKDNKNQIIYIGKAKALNKRIRSYFKTDIEDIKTRMLMQNVKYIEYLKTRDQRVALLLENKLIKKFKPKYNIISKDSKTYPYLKIVKTTYPYMTITRKYEHDKGEYFGPYVDVRSLRKIFKMISRLFPLRTCKKDLTKKHKKPCLQFHLGYCLAPCINDIDKKEYGKIVRDIKSFLKGRYKRIIVNWEKSIKSLSKELRFEEAKKIVTKLEIIRGMSNLDVKLWKIQEKDIENMLKGINKATDNLGVLLGLKKDIKVIAGFDISNISGKLAVGSRVVFKDGEPYKDMYRRYKIKFTKETPNDVAMIREIVSRSLRAKDIEDIDLYLIDGGKGQLNAAYKEIKISGLNLPVISIAKKNEYIFVPNKKEPIILDKSSNSLKLLQNVRDESHRFAIAYHKKLRSAQIR